MAHELKDSQASRVKVGYDGRVHKWYRGPLARERFENERRILRFLESQGCPFVPKVLEEDSEELYLITSNCGSRVASISAEKTAQIFEELKSFGVEHGDQADRNITYCSRLGRFCVIDFEFATITSTGEGLSVAEADAGRKRSP